MRLPPGLHPRHIFGPAKVVRILRPALPPPLTRRLARPPTFRLAAILLMMAIARIRNEERPAVQAFASAFGVHRPKPLHRLAASTKPRHQNRRTHPKGRRSTPTRRTSFLVNQGRKSYGRISAVPTATIAALSFRRWHHVLLFRQPVDFKASDTPAVQLGALGQVPHTCRIRGKQYPPEATHACRARTRRTDAIASEKENR